MSLLNITKVSEDGELCWGIVLIDEKNSPILRAEKGARKGEVISIAKALKFEGPAAPLVVDGNRVIQTGQHGSLRRRIEGG